MKSLLVLLLFVTSSNIFSEELPRYKSILEIATKVEPSSWVHTPVEQYDATQFQTVDSAEIYEVRSHKMYNAILELEFSDSTVLTETEAKYYVGNHYKTSKGRKAVLIRGLYNNFSTGGNFLVSTDSKMETVRVHYNALGYTSPNLIQFAPLVVNLPNEPEKVLITFGSYL